MLNQIPKEITDFCTTKLGRLISYSPASGGCINNGGQLITSQGHYFIKWNNAVRFPGMFAAEAEGLLMLSEARCFHVPEVVEVHEGEHYSCIIMEFISSGIRSESYWADLAEGLACLHQVSRAQYGLDHDNYIGSLPQDNTGKAHWIDFFISSRLQPQVRLAYDQGKLDQTDVKKFSRLEQQLPDLLQEEKPALTHGDLWSGNLMTGDDGRPVLIDPSVAYVHREMEIAFTKLFGGFDPVFYKMYQQIYPMETGYENRFAIYNLYPLLVHLNLFGGGYYQQVVYTLSRF